MKTCLLSFFLCIVCSLSAQQVPEYPTLRAREYAAAAEAAFDAENFGEAEKYTRLVLRELRGAEAKDTPVYAFWQERKGELYRVTDRTAEAVEIFRENAPAVRRHFGEISENYLYNRDNIAEALTDNYSHYAEAVPYRLEAFLTARELYPESDHRFINAAFKLAAEYRNAEDFERSIAVFERLLSVEEQYLGKTHFKYGHDLIQLGTVYAMQANWTAALSKIKEGWRIFSAVKGTDNTIAVVVYKHLCDAYMATGNYREALKYSRLNEAYYLADPAGLPPYLGYDYMARGDIYRLRGEPDSARIYYRKSRDFITEHLGTESGAYHTLLNVTARFNRENGCYEAAIEQYLYLTQWYAAHPEVHRLTESVPEEGLISCYYLTRQYAKAEVLYARSLEKTISVYGENHIAAAEIYMIGAYLFRILGKEEESRKAYFAWAASFRSYLNNIFLYLPAEQQQKMLQRTEILQDLLLCFASKQDEADYVDAGLDFALQYKNLSLRYTTDRQAAARLGGTEISDLYARRKAVGEAMAGCYAQPQGTQTPEFAALRETYDEIGERLARSSADLLPTAVLTRETVQTRLRPGEALLEVVRFRYTNEQRNMTDSVLYYAYLLRPDAAPERFFLFEEREIGNLNATRTRYAPRYKGEATLRNLLADKLLPALDGVQTLYWSPAGLLHRVNLGAVPVSDTEIFAERFDLHLLNDSRSLLRDKSTRSQPSAALVFGGIDYNKQAKNALDNSVVINEIERQEGLGNSFRVQRGKEWNYLKWSEKEAKTVAEILEEKDIRTDLLTGEFATEARFKNLGKESASPQILHLATHGYFFPDVDENAVNGFRKSDNPLIRSGLILAGANHVWKGGAAKDNAEDGILTAYEIAGTDLSHTELVVLSACDTGLGDIEGNEGVYGLQRAFKTAGVKYILMSLWSVNDEKTYEFMKRFYELYQREGKSVPEAYRLTQSEMRKKYALPFNPRSWAGFVLTE